MAENDVRQDKAEVRLVLDTLERLEDKTSQIGERIDRVGERVDGLHVRMDTLVETTNHRLDAFTAAISTTVKDEELLSSLGFKLINNKIVRWAAGVVFVAISGTVTYEHWAGTVNALFERFTG